MYLYDSCLKAKSCAHTEDNMYSTVLKTGLDLWNFNIVNRISPVQHEVVGQKIRPTAELFYFFSSRQNCE
jgi:hypothetical protein